jgi:hypothetical protein
MMMMHKVHMLLLYSLFRAKEFSGACLSFGQCERDG